jgi:glutamyl-tRNA synthetase
LDETTLSAIRKYAVKNAHQYGKADASSVFSKVIAVAPDAKKDIPGLRKAVQDAVNEVNAMSPAELQSSYESYAEEFSEEQKSKVEQTAKPKMVIEGAVEGSVVTRYPPEPGGYMHIGNAKQCILSDEFAKIYNGKIFLYWDDTNPEKCKQEYVDAMKSDLDWLGIKFSKEYFASDYIETMYAKGEELILSGNAYACSCEEQKIKENRFNRVACEHRLLKPEESLKIFKGMVAGEYKEGAVVIRLMGDMASDNTAIRDPTLFRIKNAPHYRLGSRYSTWPTYHMNTPIIDSINGVTDVIRSKEYEIWDPVHKLILKALKINEPRIHSEARLRIKGAVTQKRTLRDFIAKGYIKSWDDPRLLTIAGMKRRGIQPGAIREFVLRFGMSKTDSTVNIDMLLSENRKIIDQMSKHLFFVGDPFAVQVTGGDFPMDVKLKIRPNDSSAMREYHTGNDFFIAGDDAKSLHAGSIISLKDMITLEVLSIDAKSRKMSAKKIAPDSGYGKIVQWVSSGNFMECSVEVPGEMINEDGEFNPNSLKLETGYVESYASKLGKGDIVQFERFGYCRLDDPKSSTFIYISK